MCEISTTSTYTSRDRYICIYTYNIYIYIDVHSYVICVKYCLDFSDARVLSGLAVAVVWRCPSMQRWLASVSLVLLQANTRPNRRGKATGSRLLPASIASDGASEASCHFVVD